MTSPNRIPFRLPARTSPATTRSTPGRTLRAVGIALIAVAVALSATLTFGIATRRWQAAPVLTGSMAPAIPVGALIVARPQPASDVSPGDAIVFHAPTAGRPVAVHRVVTVDRVDEGIEVTTRGDANDEIDLWSPFTIRDDRVWTVSRVIPGLGRLVLAARHPGAQLLAMVALSIAVALLVPGRRRRGRVVAGQRPAVGDPIPPTRPVVIAASDTSLPATTAATTATAGSTPARSPRDGRSTTGGTHLVTRAAVAAALDEIDPDWSWRAVSVDRTGNPRFELDRRGRPVRFWLSLRVDDTERPGVGTARGGAAHAEQLLVTDALRSAASQFGVAVPGGHEPPTARQTLAPRPARLVAALVTTMLLTSGVAALATFTDSATDEITVSTGELAPPTKLNASIKEPLDSCEVELTWTATGSSAATGYEVLRQELDTGSPVDGVLEPTEPTPVGEPVVVISVEGRDTTRATDRLPSEVVEVGAAYRYTARSVRGAWRSGPSVHADVTFTGACVPGVTDAPAIEDPAPAPL